MTLGLELNDMAAAARTARTTGGTTCAADLVFITSPRVLCPSNCATTVAMNDAAAMRVMAKKTTARASSGSRQNTNVVYVPDPVLNRNLPYEIQEILTDEMTYPKSDLSDDLEQLAEHPDDLIRHVLSK